MPTLTRLSPRLLTPHARCGLLGCGGALLVRDWRPDGVRHPWRYELYCTVCQRCDPAGYSRQDAVLTAGLAFFHAHREDS